MKNPSWHLRDATKIAAEAKYTFYLPSKATIAALQVGDVVKLMFALRNPAEDEPPAERMWVKIEMIDGSGGFLGRLANDPAVIEDLNYNDHVRFSECHIMNTDIEEVDPGESLVEKYFPRCLVTNAILEGTEKVGILYREHPEVPRDSGWRLLSGSESEAYLSNPDNVQFVSLGAVLNRDDSFVELLEHPPGSRFERAKKSGKFKLIKNTKDDKSTH